MYFDYLCSRKEMPNLNDNKKVKTPMDHLNIGEFNRGQASKIIRNLVAKDNAAFIQKNGKPIAIVISYERYERLLSSGIDINEF